MPLLPMTALRKSSVVLTQEVGITLQGQNSHVSEGASTEKLEYGVSAGQPLSPVAVVLSMRSHG